MSDKGITLEGLAAAVDALRQELATWKALARKQDTLTAAQITATQSGATAAKIDQIAVNTAAIQALSAQVAGQISLEYVATLPVTGEPFTLYLVPQGDGTAPNCCNEYLWINGDWELIGTTGSMANNGELVIQVNGVAVGTFTANQAANTAVNITVPTNTNQLINGAQYVDAAALATALALKQNNLNAAQLDAVNSGITAALVTQIGTNTTAIAGKQDALTTAQQAAVDSGATAAKIGQIATNAAAIVSLTSSKQDALSTAQLAAVNSGITSTAVAQISTNTGDIATKATDTAVVHLAGAETITGDKTFTGAVATHNVTPETDGTYSLGSSSYQWASVYAQTYYYNGTEFQSKFVTADTAQTITGDKTFQGYTFIDKTGIPTTATSTEDCSLAFTKSSSLVFFQTRGSSNFRSYNSFWWSGYLNSATPYRYGRIRLYRSMGVYGDANENTPDTSFSFIDFAIHYKYVNFTENVQIINDGTENAIKPVTNNATDLGTSDNKWKTLNGINPGALGMIDTSTSVDIDTSAWVSDGVAANRVYINGANPDFPGYLFIRASGTNTDLLAVRPAGTTADKPLWTAPYYPGGGGLLHVIVPCPANTPIRVYTSVAPAVCRYFACLGNV